MRKLAAVAVCLIAGGGFATTAAPGNRFVQTILVANKASFHPQIVNPEMVNAWGIAIRPPGAGGHFWITNAGTGTSVEYIGDVNGYAALSGWTEERHARLPGIYRPRCADGHRSRLQRGQRHSRAAGRVSGVGTGRKFSTSPPMAIPEGRRDLRSSSS